MQVDPQERLLSLCAFLARAGFRIAPDQVISAAALVRSMGLRFDADEASASAALLGGIFCKNVRDQSRYAALAQAWASPVSPIEEAHDQNAGPAVKDPLPPRWIRPVAYAVCLVALLAAFALVQYARPRAFTVTLTALGPGGAKSPLEGVKVEAGTCSGDTGPDGSFHCALPARVFPVVVNAGSPPWARADLFKDQSGWRALFSITPRESIELTRKIGISSGPPQQFGRIEFFSGYTLAGPASGQPDPPPARWPGMLAILGLFAIIFMLGLVWLRRTATLERAAGPLSARQSILTGTSAMPTDGMLEAMRAFALALRQPLRGFGTKLDLHATAVKTARNAGLFAPVYGGAHERRFLIFVRRQSREDHQAFLGEALVAELFRSGVDVQSFRFDTNANVVEPYTPVLTDVQKKLNDQPARYPTMDQLLSANEQAECFVFCEPAALTDPVSGQLARWSTRMLERDPRCTVFSIGASPASDRSTALLSHAGARISAIDPNSLWKLADPAGQVDMDDAGTDGMPAILGSEYYLRRTAPAQQEIADLCATIRGHMGTRGFKWVQACAVYPDIQWVLTNAVGAYLIPAEQERGRLLARLSQMVWFRKGVMPDWLRAALAERLPKHEDAAIRAFYWTLFGADGQGSRIQVKITEPVARRDRHLLPRAVRWLRFAVGLRAQLSVKGPEQIFVRFLLGRSASPLSMRLPARMLAKLSDLSQAPAVLWAALCAAACSAVMALAVAGTSAHTPPSPPIQHVGLGYIESEATIVLSVLRDGNVLEVARRRLGTTRPVWQRGELALSNSIAPEKITVVHGGPLVFALAGDALAVIPADAPARGRTSVLAEPEAEARWLAWVPPAAGKTALPFLASLLSDSMVKFSFLTASGEQDTLAQPKFLIRDEHVKEAGQFASGYNAEYALVRTDRETLVYALSGKVASLAGSTPRLAETQKLALIAVEPSGTLPIFADCSDTGTVRLWDYSNPASGLELLGEWTTAPEAPCTALAIAPRMRVVAAGHADGQVFLYSRDNGQPVLVTTNYRGKEAVTSILFSDAMQRLIAARADLMVSVNDITVLPPLEQGYTGPDVSSATASSAPLAAAASAASAAASATHAAASASMAASSAALARASPARAKRTGTAPTIDPPSRPGVADLSAESSAEVRPTRPNQAQGAEKANSAVGLASPNQAPDNNTAPRPDAAVVPDATAPPVNQVRQAEPLKNSIENAPPPGKSPRTTK